MTAKVMSPGRLSSLFGLDLLRRAPRARDAAFIRSYLGANETVPLERFGLLFLVSWRLPGRDGGCERVHSPARRPGRGDPPPLIRELRQAAVSTWRQEPYRYYLFVRVLLTVSVVAAPLYIVEGRSHYGLLAESVGTFTVDGLLAGIFASLGWSALGDRRGLAPLARVATILSLAPPLLALAMPVIALTPLGASGGWMLVFVLLGVSTTGQERHVPRRGRAPAPERRALTIGFGNTSHRAGDSGRSANRRRRQRGRRERGVPARRNRVRRRARARASPRPVGCDCRAPRAIIQSDIAKTRRRRRDSGGRGAPAEGRYFLLYHVWTIGCQMNQADSERLARALESRGLRPAPTPESATVIILNTCSVRRAAEEKALGRAGMLRVRKRRDTGLILGSVAVWSPTTPSTTCAGSSRTSTYSSRPRVRRASRMIDARLASRGVDEYFGEPASRMAPRTARPSRPASPAGCRL